MTSNNPSLKFFTSRLISSDIENEDKLKSKDFIMQVFRKEFTGQAGLKTIRIKTIKFEEKL